LPRTGPAQDAGRRLEGRIANGGISAGLKVFRKPPGGGLRPGRFRAAKRATQAGASSHRPACACPASIPYTSAVLFSPSCPRRPRFVPGRVSFMSSSRPPRAGVQPARAGAPRRAPKQGRERNGYKQHTNLSGVQIPSYDLLSYEEKGKCSAAKQGAEFPSIGDQPEAKANQWWPCQPATHPGKCGSQSRWDWQGGYGRDGCESPSL